MTAADAAANAYRIMVVAAYGEGSPFMARPWLTSRRWLVGIGAAVLLLAGGIAAGPVASIAQGEDDSDTEVSVPSGTLDDGADLLPQASITLEQAVAAAQSAADGAVGEVDLEYVGERLVFNVDIGAYDVKVDANDGSVISTDSDD
jgi:uncharacterized membrane protein YkoI